MKNAEKLFKLENGDFIYLSDVNGLIYYKPTHTEEERRKKSHYNLISEEDVKHRVLIEREDFQSINVYFDLEESAKGYIKTLSELVDKQKEDQPED